MITRNTVNISSSSMARDTISDSTNHYLGKNGFVITVGLTFSNYSLLDDYYKDYFNFRIQEIHATTDAQGVVTFDVRDLEIER